MQSHSEEFRYSERPPPSGLEAQAERTLEAERPKASDIGLAPHVAPEGPHFAVEGAEVVPYPEVSLVVVRGLFRGRGGCGGGCRVWAEGRGRQSSSSVVLARLLDDGGRLGGGRGRKKSRELVAEDRGVDVLGSSRGSLWLRGGCGSARGRGGRRARGGLENDLAFAVPQALLDGQLDVQLALVGQADLGQDDRASGRPRRQRQAHQNLREERELKGEGKPWRKEADFTQPLQ